MDKFTLDVRDAFSGLGMPHAAGACAVRADQPASLFSVQPFAGQDGAVSAALEALGGAALPAARQSAKGKTFGMWWAGVGQWLAVGGDGAALQTALAGKAAVVDQSDGWVGFCLSGAGARDVLARLCPLDTDPSAMPPGHVARSQFAHMMAFIHVCDGGFQVLVMRSFLKTAIEDTKAAIDRLAAEAVLRG